jgi:hypothetical protein
LDFYCARSLKQQSDTSSYEVGLQRVQILKPDIPDVTMPDDVITIDVTNPQVSQKYFNTKKSMARTN